MNTLFDVCDDKCVSNTNENITRIDKNEANIPRMAKSQTYTVMKAAMKRICLTINQTAKSIYSTDLKEKEKDFLVNIHAITRK